MPSKSLSEPIIKRYKQFKFSQNSEIGNLRAISTRERWSENFLTEKASQPHRNLVFFSKKLYQKTTISDSKTCKILRVQKWVQKVSKSLSYEQILNLIIWNPWENGSLLMEKAKLLLEKGSQPPRNVVKFSIEMGALHTALHTLCT